MTSDELKNKKRTKTLATVNAVATRINKKSAMLDEVDEVHCVGRKGYAEKCKLLGIFYQVTVSIQEFRVEYPNSSYVDLYKYLHDTYPFVFDTPADKVYSGNISKMINNEPAWSKAYFCGKRDLIKIAEYRIGNMLEQDDLEDTTLLKAYDTLKKYQNDKANDAAAISEETLNTLESIEFGLKFLRP